MTKWSSPLVEIASDQASIEPRSRDVFVTASVHVPLPSPPLNSDSGDSGRKLPEYGAAPAAMAAEAWSSKAVFDRLAPPAASWRSSCTTRPAGSRRVMLSPAKWECDRSSVTLTSVISPTSPVAFSDDVAITGWTSDRGIVSGTLVEGTFVCPGPSCCPLPFWSM